MKPCDALQAVQDEADDCPPDSAKRQLATLKAQTSIERETLGTSEQNRPKNLRMISLAKATNLVLTNILQSTEPQNQPKK